VARERAESLEPRLSRLKVVVPPDAQVEGLRIVRGEVEVGRAQWGLPVPADPGVHLVRASAPGRQQWETEVEVPADGAVYTLTIVALEPAPDDPAAGGARDPARADTGFFGSLTLQQQIGLGAAAVGVVALGVGSAFGLMAISDDAASDEDCEGNVCNPEGARLRNDARDKGDIATVGFIAGGALLSTGAVLFFTGAAEQGGEASAQVEAGSDGERAWVRLRGEF
jgi:hypothetical protein